MDAASIAKLEGDQWELILAQTTVYRLTSRYQDCWDAAMAGLKICPFYANTLFYFEIGIVAFYLQKFKEGLEALNYVMKDPYTDATNYQCCINNLKFYIQPIEGQHSTTNVRDYYSGFDKAFVGSSISYGTNGKDIITCYRVVNYKIVDGKYLVTPTPGCAPDVVHTRNFLVQGTVPWNTNVRELVCPEWMIPYPSLVRGLEDVRLFGDQMFTCISRSHNPKNIAKVCYGKYDLHGIVTFLTPVVHQEDAHEKNMLPFTLEGDPHVLNFCDGHLLVMKIDAKEGKLKQVHQVEVPNGGRLRGSAGPIPYRDGWLFTVHEGEYDGNRKYYHRLMWLANDFSAVKRGNIFSFTNNPIEFNIGIYISPQSGEIVLGYSVNDSSTHQLRITRDNPWMPDV